MYHETEVQSNEIIIMQYELSVFDKDNGKIILVRLIAEEEPAIKLYEEQVRIAKEVLHSTKHSASIKKLVKGLMIESYIEDGCQKIDEGIYGKSITDPCLGWEKTEKLIYELAELRKKIK